MTHPEPTATSLSVELADRSYPITIGRALDHALRTRIETLSTARRPVAAIVDAGLAAAQPDWLDTVLGSVPRFTVPSGETSKSLDTLGRIYAFLAESALDRTGVVLAIGGGVTGDLAGFAAASYLRGLPFIQVPTTLLAMVDSSVGGKTGINLPAGKNLVGAFHQPLAVIADLEVLKTLPPREFNAGMAEVIKTGLLGDAELFERVAAAVPLEAGDGELAHRIRACCAVKAAVVAGDERETAGSGGRALLNLGHTFAHAIETVAGYGTLLHGEAVAIGLVAAARLSLQLERIDAATAERIEDVVAAQGLPVRLPEHPTLPIDALMDAMTRDKKVRAGKLRFVVLDQIGSAATVDGIESASIRAIWEGLQPGLTGD
ncbi:MAG: 3-dehydroquinate synthase [Opitutales bacterium]